MTKETSDEMASVASRVLGAGNPLEDDKVIDDIAARLAKNGMTFKGIEFIRPALRKVLVDSPVGVACEAAASLAGSVLSQKED